MANNSSQASTSPHDTGTVNNTIAQPSGKRKSRYNKSGVMKHAWQMYRIAEARIRKSTQAGISYVTALGEAWSNALRNAWEIAKNAIEIDLDFSIESMSVGEKYYPKSQMNYARGIDGAYYLKRNLLKV